jgi:AraC-like DNA-binding protein
MTNEEIAKAAYDAGFSSSEIFKRLASFKRMIDSIASAERDARYMGDNNREDMDAKRCAAAIRARSNA